MKPTPKPKRTAEQRAEEEAIRRQHAASPIRQRPAGVINRQSFAAILSLVARFKAVRESQGLKLAEVAGRMGIDAPALSRLETGKMLNPTLATLHKWAEALGQKLDIGLSSAESGDHEMERTAKGANCMPYDLIFRLSPGGGPPPEAEILFHAQRAREYDYTWVGLHFPRKGHRLHEKQIRYGTSHVYLITSEARRRKTVLRGIVREVTNTRPDDELLGDIYSGHDFPWWWRLDSVECLVSDFDALGLRKAKDNTPYDVEWLSKRQTMNYLKPVSAWPSGAVDAGDVGNLVEAAQSVSDLVAPPLTKEEPAFVVPNTLTNVVAAPGTTIHAVDWSGGGDFGAPNSKIRYARWEFTAADSSVTVLPAALSRRDILRMIREMPGLWILDFPFGLPVELMRRAGTPLNDLGATLAFTRSVPKHEFRDHCKAVWATSGQRESKYRATERAVGCGWFDWFVQLFRQTWTGQVEILSALREVGDPAAILPWDHDRNVGTRLVEGFPGASLRARRLPAEGYKHPGNHASAVRAEIVEGLVARGLPLTAEVSAESIADTTGDLINALVMLLAGRDALATDHTAIRAELHRRGLLAEGWIYQ